MSRFVRPVTMLASFGLFVLSLPFDAAVYERVAHGGWFMLLMGWMGLMMFHLGWCANPLLFVAWLTFAFGKRRGVRITSVALFSVATLFALSSFVTLGSLEMIGRNEGEMAGDLDHFGPSIFLWTASIVVGLVGAIVRLRQREATPS